MSFYISFIFANRNFIIIAMNITSNTLVREVVKLNFKTDTIFRANNIDYCCGGDKIISDACKEVRGFEDQLIK